MLLGAVPASVDERTVLDNLPGTASGVEAAGVRYDWQPMRSHGAGASRATSGIRAGTA